MEQKNKTLIIGINLGDFGSTGGIMRNSLEYAHEHGDFDYLVIVPLSKGKPNTFAFFENSAHLIDKLDRHYFHRSINNPDGFFERRATLRIINKIKEKCFEYEKVIVHLHNIHMAHIDLRVLLSILAKEKRISKVFYTLHDCWSFTGGCYHFEKCGCDKWKTGCKGNCPQHYEKKHFSCEKNLALKVKYTHLLKDKLTILPVSKWCDNLLKQSLLGDIDSKVINGECSITPLSDPDLVLKKTLGISETDKVLITVDGWKSGEYLNSLIDLLPSNYKIIVINGSKDLKTSSNVIAIDKVPNELMNAYYSISDCYVSLTQEDTLPLTLMEAQICGVPVVGFGHGGTPEEIVEGITGTMVGKKNDVSKIFKAIVNTVENQPYKKEDIILNGKNFERLSSAKRYLELYGK